VKLVRVYSTMICGNKLVMELVAFAIRVLIPQSFGTI
jgi:hypothetical protein